MHVEFPELKAVLQKRTMRQRGATCLLVAFICFIPPGRAPAQATAEAREHDRRADTYLKANQPQLAIPELKAVLAVEPDNAEAAANLGVLLFFSNNYGEAIPYLRRAVGQRPELTKIRALLGLGEKNVGDAGKARVDLASALPNLVDTKLRVQTGLALVELQVATQDMNGASQTIALLREVAPTDPRVLYAAYRIATDQAGEAMLSLTLTAPDSAEMHQVMAHELERAHDIPATIANLRKAAELDPKLPGIHYELAEALGASDDPTLRRQAEAQYQLAVQENARDARSIAALGDLAMDRGDISSAMNFYTRALTIDPHLSAALIGLARTEANQGNLASAASRLEQVTQFDPTNAVAHFRLSAIYRKLNRPGDATRELEVFQHLKQIKEKMRTVYQQMRQMPLADRPDQEAAR